MQRVIFYSLLCCLCFPSWAESIKQAVAHLTPAQYVCVKYVSVDLNKDGRCDLVLACQPKNINDSQIVNHLPARLLVFLATKDSWKQVWNYTERYDKQDFYYCFGRDEGKPSVEEPFLEVKDINGDGIKEIIFTISYIGGSEGSLSTHIYAYQKGKFLNLEKRGWLGHFMEGGVFIDSVRKRLCSYSYILGDNECHADPHKYKADVLSWNGHQYVKTSEFITLQKGDAGIAEVKSTFTADKNFRGKITK